jgi:hypothetical protein
MNTAMQNRLATKAEQASFGKQVLVGWELKVAMLQKDFSCLL